MSLPGRSVLGSGCFLSCRKEDHRVEVNGRHYIQKSAGTALKEASDIHSGTGGYMKTLLLTPAP